MDSYLGRVNYNYDDRYLITFNGRRDGSSKFSREHRGGNFGSVAGAWNVSNEKFIRLPDVMSFLKLRGGYGTLGNQNFPSYYGYTTYINNNASCLFLSPWARPIPICKRRVCAQQRFRIYGQLEEDLRPFRPHRRRQCPYAKESGTTIRRDQRHGRRRRRYQSPFYM